MATDLLMPLRRLHGRMYETKIEWEETKCICKQVKEADKSTIFYVFTPTHSNLGDHAIALSTKELLAKLKIKYIEITDKQLRLLKRFRKLGVMNGRTILVHGGGFLGTLWFNAEELLRCIIRDNQDSSILCLPNTIYYENTEWGNQELERSKKIYNHHPALQLCAREQESFDLMDSLYRSVKLIPDMVLFMNKSQGPKDRAGCLLCLRNDHEKTRTKGQEKQILTSAQTLFREQVRYTDMCLDHNISPEMRTQEMGVKLDEFKGAQLVITDRLHGMIFAAITGTPCIVINSKSPKVRGCYEWIKDLDYIRFADNIEQIEDLYRQIPSGPHRYDNSHLLPYYEELKDLILETVRRS